MDKALEGAINFVFDGGVHFGKTRRTNGHLPGIIGYNHYHRG